MAVVLGWLGAVALAEWLARRAGTHMSLCMFKRVTGYPCPSCGLTRGALQLLEGRIATAWAYNPLLFTVFAAAGVLLLVRLTFGRTVHVELSRRERKAAWVVVAGLFLLNWAYVIACVG